MSDHGRRAFLAKSMQIGAGLVLSGKPASADVADSADAAKYISRTTEGKNILQLQEMIADTVAVGRHTVTLPAGRFYLANNRAEIHRIQDLTIEGAGQESTTLVADAWAGSTINVGESQRITLRNFALDRDPLPFVQATITRISNADPNTVAMDFAVHDGYPRLTNKLLASVYGCGQFFGRETRRLKHPDKWFGPRAGKTVMRVDDDHGRLLLSGDWKARVAEGDYVVIPGGTGGGAAVFMNSDTIRVEDVSVLASPSLAMAAHFATGENYFRYTIKPGPPPEGAKQARLLATNADGMQYFWCPGAVTFEGCDFSFTGDDSINISIPQAMTVTEVLSPTRFHLRARLAAGDARQTVALSQAGDVVRPERMGTYEPLGDVPLQSILYEDTERGEDGHPESHLTVEVQHAPAQPVKVGDAVVLRKFLPKRFTIRHSRFRETRARGLLIMASSGVIENNVIERTALAGIYLLQEMAGYGGAGGADWVSNVLVRGNTIRDVCYNDTSPISAIAAIQLFSRPAALAGQSPSYPWVAAHHNIRIVGNTIDGCDAAGILINGLDGGEVRDNIIKNTNLQRGGAEVSFAAGSPLTVPYAITVMNSRGVQVEGNKVSHLGPHAKGEAGDVGTFPPA